ncbi:MAG: hypothetical protein AAF950_17720 [Pseudomonadota bacterium]
MAGIFDAQIPKHADNDNYELSEHTKQAMTAGGFDINDPEDVQYFVEVEQSSEDDDLLYKDDGDTRIWDGSW